MDSATRRCLALVGQAVLPWLLLNQRRLPGSSRRRIQIQGVTVHIACRGKWAEFLAQIALRGELCVSIHSHLSQILIASLWTRGDISGHCDVQHSEGLQMSRIMSRGLACRTQHTSLDETIAQLVYLRTLNTLPFHCSAEPKSRPHLFQRRRENLNASSTHLHLSSQCGTPVPLCIERGSGGCDPTGISNSRFSAG